MAVYRLLVNQGKLFTEYSYCRYQEMANQPVTCVQGPMAVSKEDTARYEYARRLFIGGL
ncbi:MAG: hypothetical protein ABS943_08725 [Pantoea agglomerans]